MKRVKNVVYQGKIEDAKQLKLCEKTIIISCSNKLDDYRQ